jgi:citrate lyase subunit beta / citryl-CoA lyase
MSAPARPRRSTLYMPGSNPRALEKARGLAADALIFDLEDAVAPDAKAGARETIAAALAQGGYGKRELLLRVNAMATPWGHADLLAAAKMPVDGVVLHKVESADAVRQAETVLAAAGAPGSVGIWCMMETPMGVLRADEIAGASPKVAGLIMGTSDLAKDLHAQHTRERLPMLTSLGLCLLAARAHRVAILDGVHLDLDDEEGLAFSCRQGRELGFDGKTLIHPKQLVEANTAFAPSTEEVAWARKIIAAHAEAVAAGKGLLLVDGKLVENLHVKDARRLVAMADAIAAMDAGS